MSVVEWVAVSGAVLVFLLLLWRPASGMAALVILYPFNGFVPRLPFAGLNAETILLGVAAALTLMRFGVRVPPLRYSGPVMAFLFVLLTAWGIGIVTASGVEQLMTQEGGISGSVTWDLFKHVKTLAFPTLFVLLAYFWFPDRESRYRLLRAASVGVAIVAADGVAEFALLRTQGVEARIASLFGNANGLGSFLAAFSLIPLYLTRHPDTSRFGRCFHALAYAAAQVALVVSLSRASWIAVVASHVIWFGYMNRQLLAVGMLALVLVIALGYPFFPKFIRDRVEGSFRTRQYSFQVGGHVLGGSAVDRIVYYRVGLDMFIDSPLWGHGLEGFWMLSPRYGAKYGLVQPISPHSLVVELAVHAGLIGMTIFGWMALTIVALGHRVWRYGGPERALGPLLIAAWVGILTGDLFHTAFLGVHQLSAYFWILMAVAMREVEEPEDEEIEDEEEAASPAFALSPAAGPPFAGLRPARPLR